MLLNLPSPSFRKSPSSLILRKVTTPKSAKESAGFPILSTLQAFLAFEPPSNFQRFIPSPSPLAHRCAGITH